MWLGCPFERGKTPRELSLCGWEAGQKHPVEDWGGGERERSCQEARHPPPARKGGAEHVARSAVPKASRTLEKGFHHSLDCDSPTGLCSNQKDMAHIT